ncbi:MAG: hypothetical protein FD134_807 [Gallionellaceae bacterium]|nr:MAG: hypothetical protein FD134_807 [Gallionellaceae bacterium]
MALFKHMSPSWYRTLICDWHKRGLLAGILALGLVYVLFAGLWKSGDVRWLDSRMYYVAGAALDSGKSPYNDQALREIWQHAIGKDIPYALPSGGLPITPSIGPFFAVFAKIPWEIARWTFDIFSLIFGLGGVVYFLHKLDHDRYGGTFTEPRTLIATTGICVISGVPAALFLGQPSLITMTGILGAMYYAVKERPLVAAIFFYFACFKAPLSLLPLFYLFVFGTWRPLLAGITVILVSSCWTLYTLRSTNLMQDVANSIRGYSAIPANQPPLVTGLHSLITAVGGASNVLVWLIVSLGIVAAPAVATRLKNEWSTGRKRYLEYGEPWLLPFITAGVFIQMKPYDAIIFAPVLYWLLRRGNRGCALYAPGILLAIRPDLPTKLSVVLFDAPSNHPLLMQAQVTTIASIYLFLCLLWRLVKHNETNNAA